MVKSRIKIEVVSLGKEYQANLQDDVVGINIQNNGTSDVYIGWNERADTKKCICLPGSSRPFGVGDNYSLGDNSLYIEFGSVGTKQCELIILRDKGPINCNP